MGLLDNALDKKDNKKKSNDLSNSYRKSVKVFFSEEKRLPVDETYSSSVQALINRCFNIKKSIMLIYNSRVDSWIPVSTSGIDITSARRLRFNNRFFSNNFNNDYSSIESSDELLKFKTFFSIREFSMLNKIEIFHRNDHEHGNRAAFMILNGEILETSLFSQLKQAVNIVLEKVPDLMEDSERTDSNRSTLNLFVSQYIQKHKDTRIFLFRLNYFDFISLIREILTEDVEENQLAQDIFDTVYSMINISGKLLQIDTYSALLLYSSRSIHNPKLLIAQITNAIKNFFNIKIDVPSISNSFVSYPEDGTVAEEFLNKLEIL